MIPKIINSKLIEIIPEIKELFQYVTEWQDGIDTGSTIVIEDVFMVFLKECLKNNYNEYIYKCSLFLEWLSEHFDDEYASVVLTISVFEYIHFASDRIQLESVFGLQTRKLYDSYVSLLNL